jgi:hypothetical protein
MEKEHIKMAMLRQEQTFRQQVQLHSCSHTGRAVHILLLHNDAEIVR